MSSLRETAVTGGGQNQASGWVLQRESDVARPLHHQWLISARGHAYLCAPGVAAEE
jgi:hypothetical protein